MTEKFYSINGVVNFALTGSRKFASSVRYRNYLSDHVSRHDLDFVISLGTFNANLQNCQILDDKYYVKYNYLYCKDEYKLLKWEIEISNFEKEWPISVNLNITPRLMKNSAIAHALIEGFIVDAMIHHILTEKGYALLHASCVSRNGRGLLFLARGGGGKTTMALRLLKLGFRFVSDNFTILSPSKKAMGFVEPLNIFTYNLDDAVYGRMNVSQKFGLKFRHLLYKLSNGYLKIFTRLDPYEVFKDKIEEKEIEIDSIFLLLPNKDLVSPKLHELPKDELIKHIHLNQRLEFPYFDEYLSAYSYAFPNSSLSSHWEKYKRNLTNNINKDVSIYKIEVPKSYDRSVFNKILEVVQ